MEDRNTDFGMGHPPNMPDWGKPIEHGSYKLWRSVIIALIVVLSFGVGIMLSRGRDSRTLNKLREENRLLRDKLELYDAAIDSIYQKLDLAPAEQEEMQSFPHLDQSLDYHERGSGDAVLRRRLNIIEKKMIAILESAQDGKQDEIQDARNIPAIYPSFGRISDGWGMRIHPISRRLEFHHGIDIANKEGTAVYATAAGRVIKADYDRGFGKKVVIDHGNGYSTLYAHLDVQRAKVGEEVEKGQIIGLMGKTGISTGAHLHYEVHFKGQKLNPVGYLNRIESYARR